MFLAKITVNLNIPVGAGRYVRTSLHGKHALNILHAPVHDMLPHPLHYWNIQVYSDFS